MFKFGRKVIVKVRDFENELVIDGGYSEERKELFDIDFDVELVDSQEPSESTITIYNLNKKSRDFCASAVQVEILAGYKNDSGENVQSLFVGEPVLINTTLQKGEWITDITLSSSLILTKQAKFSKSFPAGATIQIVFGELAKQLNIPLVIDEALSKIPATTRGFSLSGNIRSCLYEASSHFQVSFVTIYATLFVGPLNGNTLGGQPSISGQTRAVVISEDTGLLGTPTEIWTFKKQDILDASGNQKTDATGQVMTKTLTTRNVEASVLLEPSIRLGSVVKIDAPQAALSLSGEVEMRGASNEGVTGFFVCDRVRHYGTTSANGDFNTDVFGTDYK